jgi:hypothetical protein
MLFFVIPTIVIRMTVIPAEAGMTGKGISETQNGFTITKITMIAVAIPGISFMKRSDVSEAGR